ncbi:hypothetical protein CAOG_02052 [Capsaspora owczarzaki ATCC 30864]|uniref:hypothetical protein n=1 Tax=Capsaspora owczarzaki (strain ATCC 30864) TaxID=595528 RepID=UPI0003525401|nr:hypothetical protein CAOG_02052 [Capsaspora owczarzaki ATCC 30864]|eukprot:XP_004348802.2 hypothetical protein CAOG_02052 [Capsaspora owczarzaki ATCC 30864]
MPKLVQTKGLGLDPSMRSQLHPATSLSGAAPFTIGNVCSGPGYGVVLASNNPHFLKHDWVSSASWPWQTVAAFRSTSSLAPVDPMNGVALAEIPLLTAYLAVKQLGTLEPGSTVAVTDAHGPLATLICQFARLLLRARIIVLTNSDAKCRVFREDSDVAGVVNCAYYLDSTTGSNAHPVSQNSSSASSSPDALGALTTAVHLHCPSEIHALIDTVGGPVLLAAARLIKAGGKIVTCEQPHGLLDDRARSCSNSLVNSSKPPPLPLLVLKRLSARRITRHHLLLANHVAELPTLLQTIQQLVATDQLHLRKTIFDGIDSIPAAFETMLDTRPSSCGILQVRI